MLGLLLFFVFVQGIFQPLHGWDARTIYATTAKIIFGEGGVLVDSIADEHRIQYHRNYPLLVPPQLAFCMDGGAVSGYADIPFAYFWGGAVLMTSLFITHRDLRLIVLAGLFQGFSTLTKNEGLAVTLLLQAGLALLLFFDDDPRRRGAFWKAPMPLVTLAVLVSFSWRPRAAPFSSRVCRGGVPTPPVCRLLDVAELLATSPLGASCHSGGQRCLLLFP